MIICWICRRTISHNIVSPSARRYFYKGTELTRQDEEDDPVDHQDGPKDRDIENGEPRADEADGDGPGSGVPELELGKATDEGAELVVLLGGKAGGGVTVLKAFVLGEGGVEFGLKEEQEEVQEVDAEGVCDCEHG